MEAYILLNRDIYCKHLYVEPLIKTLTIKDTIEFTSIQRTIFMVSYNTFVTSKKWTASLKRTKISPNVFL